MCRLLIPADPDTTPLGIRLHRPTDPEIGQGTGCRWVISSADPSTGGGVGIGQAVVERTPGTIPRMQTRYLILASLVTGLAILAAAAVWFTQL